MEQEEEENICDSDDVIYADPSRRSRCRSRGLSPGYAHRVKWQTYYY